jgi:hypothetical protein
VCGTGRRALARCACCSGPPRGATAAVREPSWAELIGLAWLYALHARSSIARARVWQAEHMISGMRDQVLALACLRDGVPAVQGRGMDSLPPDVTACITPALVRSLEIPELKRAFAAITTSSAPRNRTDRCRTGPPSPAATQRPRQLNVTSNRWHRDLTLYAGGEDVGSGHQVRVTARSSQVSSSSINASIAALLRRHRPWREGQQQPAAHRAAHASVWAPAVGGSALLSAIDSPHPANVAKRELPTTSRSLTTARPVRRRSHRL